MHFYNEKYNTVWVVNQIITDGGSHVYSADLL